VLALCNAAAAARTSSQTDLFATAGVQQRRELKLPIVDGWPPIEKLKAEFDALGFYLSAHPLDDYDGILRRANITPYAEFFERLDDTERSVKLAGTIVAKREQRSQRGNPFAFVTLSDQSGEYEVTLFSELLSAHRELLETGSLVVMNVTGRLDRDRPRLTAQSLQAVDKLADAATGGLRVFVADAKPLASLQDRLKASGQGKGYVHLVLLAKERRPEIEMRIPGSYAVGPRVRGALTAIAGVIDVQEC
jgi:DNA polymerase-3 subunit alpha